MSYENKLIDALTDLIKNTTVTLYDGTAIKLDSVHYAYLPSIVDSFTNIVIIPRGPQFRTVHLGTGAKMNNREKVIAIDVLVMHDGYEQELAIKNMSEIIEALIGLVIDNNRLAGAYTVDVIDCEYDWVRASEQDVNSNTVVSYGVFTIVAKFRR